MDAEIISVGTEIVLGQIVNTNAAYLANRLTQLDLPATYQTTVDKLYLNLPPDFLLLSPVLALVF